MLLRRVVVALLALSLATPAFAARIENVVFPEQHRAGDTLLRLAGVGLLRYRIVFKAYVAALYLPHGVAADAVLTNVPKRLEIEYFWSIRADGFAQATWDGVALNASPTERQALRLRIERLNALYEDVEPGDRYALTYVPGIGTELAFNGEPLGSIEGADFAEALFAIWLGPQPLDASLKAQLLGRS